MSSVRINKQRRSAGLNKKTAHRRRKFKNSDFGLDIYKEQKNKSLKRDKTNLTDYWSV